MSTLTIRRLSDVAAAQTEWLWQARIPRGEFTIVEGDKGCGKSTLTIKIAAAVTTGRAADLPSNAGEWQPRNILMLGGEDDEAEVRRRLEAAGGDPNRAIILDAAETVTLADEGAALEAVVVEHDVALVIIDPISDYLAANINQGQAVRKELQAFLVMARRRKTTVIGIRHTTKSAISSSAAGVGSYALGARARSVLLVAKHPTEPGIFEVASSKNSYVAPPPSARFRLLGQPTAAIEWAGESSTTAEQLLKPATAFNQGKALAEAKAFYLEVLSQGGVASATIEKLARNEGISKMTLRRAGDEVGIESRRSGFGPGSTCYRFLPGDDRVAPVDGQDDPIPAQAEVSIYGGGRDLVLPDAAIPRSTPILPPRAAQPMPQPRPESSTELRPDPAKGDGATPDRREPSRFSLLEVD